MTNQDQPMLGQVGVAVVDVTPPPGLPLAGYAARTGVATGAHGRLTVRALTVGESAIVTIDTCVLPGVVDDRIRAGAGENTAVHVLHTHAAPMLAGAFNGEGDPAWTEQVIEAAVSAVADARASAVPARLLAGWGSDPHVARNRRHPGGPVDPEVPVFRFVRDSDGTTVATLVSYACHPVVCGSANLLMTADYPAAARQTIQDAWGGIAVFLTGCAGDANPGDHIPSDSYAEVEDPTRTPEAADQVGRQIGEAALAAQLTEVAAGPWTSRRAWVTLQRLRPSRAEMLAEQQEFARMVADGDPGLQQLYRIWLDWVERELPNADDVPVLVDTPAPVSVLRWGDAWLALLPHEPFHTAAFAIREALGPGVGMVAGYTDCVHGYLPSSTEYPYGGYEVADSHRYYDAPGPFIEGSLELVIATAIELGKQPDPQ